MFVLLKLGCFGDQLFLHITFQKQPVVSITEGAGVVFLFILRTSKHEVGTFFILPIQQLPKFTFSSNGIP